MRLVERKIARQLEMERDLDPPVDIEDLEVVKLADLRHRQRGGEHTLAQRPGALARFDVDDDIDPGQRAVESLLDAVGSSMPLADRRAGRDSDHDIREVLSARTPEPEPAKLDGRIEAGDRLPRDPRVVLRRAIHEDVHVATGEPQRRDDDEAGDEERGDRVAGGEAERRGDEAGEHRERAGEVAPEVECVGEERVRAVAPRASSARPTVRDASIASTSAIAANVHHVGLDLELDDSGQAKDRRDRDADTDEDQEAGLGERGEVLRLRRAPTGGRGRRGALRPRPRRTSERCSEIRTRVRSLGEQPEARARKPGDELDRDEEAGGPDRDERGAPLRRHGGKARSADGRVQRPAFRHALELVLAALLERNPRADDGVAHRSSHQHVTRLGQRGHSYADVYGDSGDAVGEARELAGMEPAPHVEAAEACFVANSPGKAMSASPERT